MIYFDNAATSMQKPETVIHAVTQALHSLGNAGRGAHEASLDASRNIHRRYILWEMQDGAHMRRPLTHPEIFLE